MPERRPESDAAHRVWDAKRKRWIIYPPINTNQRVWFGGSR